VTEGFERAPARAMLRAVGMREEDFGKPQVGVASSWNEVTPCNLSLARLARVAKEGVRAAGGFPLEFTTIAVSDGISMGHEGMRASLVSREVIADSVETVMHAERFDAMVTFAGCDKSLPGMVMAAARLDLPAVFLYGGTILPGRLDGRDIDIKDVFEAVGARAAGAIDDAELHEVEARACPSEGACAGMYTANTMASAIEAMGLSLPGSASPPAVDPRREDLARRSGEAVLGLLEADLPRVMGPCSPTPPRPWPATSRTGGTASARCSTPWRPGTARQRRSSRGCTPTSTPSCIAPRSAAYGPTSPSCWPRDASANAAASTEPDPEPRH